MTESNWGSVLTLGVEEELMLVDAETLSQRPASSDVIPRVQVERGLVKHELFESIVELNSGVCASPEEALDVVRALRRATADAASEIGCTIAAAGSHPTDIASEQEIADDPHYRGFVEYAGPTARRQGVQGLHVHVGMPDGETCLRVLEHFMPWLPVDPRAVGELARGSRESAPGCSPRVRRFSACSRGTARRRASSRGPTGSSSSAASSTQASSPGTAASTGTSGRIRGSGRSRCACPTSRRTFGAPAPSSRSCMRSPRGRSSSRRRPPPRATAPSSCRTAGPRRASARARSSSIPSATARPSRAVDLYGELVERIGVDPLNDTSCEADVQLAFDDPHEATADIVRRSLT